MTIFRLALRSHSGGFAATTAVAILFGLANSVGFAQIAGTDPAGRAVFARQMEIVGRQLSYLLPLPAELDTMAGYLHWRMFGTLPLVFGFWSVVAASGAGRGDEERGLVEAWLSAGISRARYLLARAAAFTVAATASIAVMLAATWGGSVAGNEALGVDRLALQGVALIAITACSYAASLLVAQLVTTRRAAAGIGGVLLLALFLVNSGARSGALEELRWLSPFWGYERSTPLLRSGSLDAGATSALLGASLALVALSMGAFAARDIGGPLLRMAPRTGARVVWPSGDPLLRLPVLAIVGQQRLWIAGWTLGMAGLAAFLVSLTRTMVDALLAIPTMRAYFERLGPTGGYDSFVGVIWASTALLLLSLFAIVQVNTWVADDAEGRLEAVLAQPVTRARVVYERLGSLAVAAAVIAAGGAAAVWATATAAGIALSGDRFVLGSALMPTVPLAFGAIGAVGASWRPRLAVPVLTVVAVAGYFTQQFAPLFDWPRWVENASIYALYGQPLAKGVEWGGISALVALAVVGTAIAAALMQRRDVGR